MTRQRTAARETKGASDGCGNPRSILSSGSVTQKDKEEVCFIFYFYFFY